MVQILYLDFALAQESRQEYMRELLLIFTWGARKVVFVVLMLCCCHAVAMRFVVTKPNQFRVDVHSGSIVLLKLYMDLQKLSFEFVFCTLPNKTNLKFYLDSLIGLMSLIKFEDTMPWACCAFGNVSILRLSEIFF